MDLKQLELVQVICREGSFSNAARRLGLSQPTLSKGVAKLERTLGVELFDRSGGAARPTAYGRFLADRADTILASVNALYDELHNWAAGDLGRLRIGIGPATRVKPLPGLLAALNRDFPDVTVRVRQASGAALVRGVAEGDLDLALSYAGNADGFDDLMRIQIFSDDIVAAARPDHPIFANEVIGPAQLLDHRLGCLGVVPSFRSWMGVMTDAQQRNLEAFVCDDAQLLRERLAGSDIVAHGPAFVFADEAACGRWRTRVIERPDRFECWMLTTRAHWRSPLIKAVAQMARAATMG